VLHIRKEVGWFLGNPTALVMPFMALHGHQKLCGKKPGYL